MHCSRNLLIIDASLVFARHSLLMESRHWGGCRIEIKTHTNAIAQAATHKSVHLIELISVSRGTSAKADHTRVGKADALKMHRHQSPELSTRVRNPRECAGNCFAFNWRRRSEHCDEDATQRDSPGISTCTRAHDATAGTLAHSVGTCTHLRRATYGHTIRSLQVPHGRCVALSACVRWCGSSEPQGAVVNSAPVLFRTTLRCSSSADQNGPGANVRRAFRDAFGRRFDRRRCARLDESENYPSHAHRCLHQLTVLGAGPDIVRLAVLAVFVQIYVFAVRPIRYASSN